MPLRRIQVSDFRCLRSAEINLDPRFTLITGPNASGKTSLLEAIYVLGRGRSFRTRKIDKLIRAGSDEFVIFGEVVLPARLVSLGIRGSTDGLEARLAGTAASSLSELAAALPVQIIDPEVHRLIEEGPSRRRRFMDWGVFHVEHDFVPHWQRYQQVLRQRNAALKTRQARSLVSAWDHDLTRLAEYITSARTRYVARLQESAAAIAHRLLGLELDLGYRPGWSRDLSFSDALKANWAHDQDAGTTQVGPQRAELSIKLGGTLVKDRISRGQQKLLAASLLLAQLTLLTNGELLRPTLLLDDPAAELDSERLLNLIQEVGQQSLQLVVTSLSESFGALGAPGRRYRICEGDLSES